MTTLACTSTVPHYATCHNRQTAGSQCLSMSAQCTLPPGRHADCSVQQLDGVCVQLCASHHTLTSHPACVSWSWLQVIDERLQQVLEVESQRHAQMQPSGNIIQHVQRGTGQRCAADGYQNHHRQLQLQGTAADHILPPVLNLHVEQAVVLGCMWLSPGPSVCGCHVLQSHLMPSAPGTLHTPQSLCGCCSSQTMRHSTTQ